MEVLLLLLPQAHPIDDLGEHLEKRLAVWPQEPVSSHTSDTMEQRKKQSTSFWGRARVSLMTRHRVTPVLNSLVYSVLGPVGRALSILY